MKRSIVLCVCAACFVGAGIPLGLRSVDPTGENQPPDAALQAVPTTVTSGGTTMLLPAAGTFDSDGTIVLYEYDFSYSGEFTVDYSSPTASPVTTPPLINVGGAPIFMVMALRVTDDGNPGLTAEGTVQVAVNPPPAIPTWTQIHAMITGGAPGGGDSCVQCHASSSGGLVMNSDKNATYGNLVGVESFGCKPETRVVAGNSGASYLIKKLSGAAACGSRMPLSGGYWTAEEIQMVRDWIDSGAPNN